MTGQSIRLSSEQRRFLSRVREAIYTNPFAIAREQLEHWLPSDDSALRPGGEHHFGPIGRAVDLFLQELDRYGLVCLTRFSVENAELISHALLFQVYHRYVDAMDRHIVDQLDHPRKPLVAPYAEAMLEDLQVRGFEPEEACRYLAIFFQMRRAFYFIDTALVGQSPVMEALRADLWSAVFSNDARRYDRYLWNRMEEFSTLLLGPTGSGKGAAAGAIGRSGYIPYEPDRRRFRESFADTLVQTNLSEFSEGLIESELFGHRKGAFTGAIENHIGLFEACSPSGSLFLDEIGDAGLSVQLKLLRVLQERRFSPVGSHEPRRFRGRLITATHRDLEELRAQGLFRDDLYYRLSALVIEIPSLQQRIHESKQELPLMIDLLVTRTLGQSAPEAVNEVHQQLRRQLPPNYPWPGNVRELEQAVRRTLLSQPFWPGGVVSVGEASELQTLLMCEQPSARALLGGYCTGLYERYGSYEEVARRTGLDRRTVKKYLDGG